MKPANDVILGDKNILKNIRYLRVAAKVLKVIVVFNTLSGLLGLYLNLAGAQQVSVGDVVINNEPGILTTGSYIVATFVGIFILYTAARGLELFADVAAKLTGTSNSLIQQPTTSQKDDY